MTERELIKLLYDVLGRAFLEEKEYALINHLRNAAWTHEADKVLALTVGSGFLKDKP